MLRIYDYGKNGRREIAIVTDCSEEHDLLNRLAESFCSSEIGDDREATAQVFARATDIICKLRGYKNDVKERRLLLAGDVWPADNAEPVATEASDDIGAKADA